MQKLRPLKILLAEDNIDHAELTVDVLSEIHGQNEIVHVLDGEEAISHLTLEPLPDIVLLDIKMPKKSGLEVLEFIRSEEKLRHLPTIILTTSQNSSEIQQAYAVGANSFVTKPVEFDELVERIRELNTYWGMTVKLPSERSL